MRDIVERLREKTSRDNRALLDEAAGEIEVLRRGLICSELELAGEIERLRGLKIEWHDPMDELPSNCDWVIGALDGGNYKKAVCEVDWDDYEYPTFWNEGMDVTEYVKAWAYMPEYPNLKKR